MSYKMSILLFKPVWQFVDNASKNVVHMLSIAGSQSVVH